MIKSVSLLAAILVSATSFASSSGPLLTKSTGAGFVPPGLRHFTKCEIYTNKIVLTQGAEGVQSVQERQAALTGLAEAIDGASKGRIQEESAPTDGPALVYTATKILPGDATEKVDLGTYTGGDGKRTLNTSAAAQGLRNLADMLCK